MRELETDYLIVGAGASGMAFVDTLIAHSCADVVVVDRRHRPGGHWLDAYPFVRIHQTSANYGVPSRKLGDDRIDDSGPNAGFYERASASEICAYYLHVLEDTLLPSGRVRFFGMSDYRSESSDGHHFVSVLGGEETVVKVRRKLVDATYVESEIPSRHAPPFEADPDVRLIPPNELVHLGEPVRGYTILGGGKTSMDTCTWLLDQGVAPDNIRWIRPRDPWIFDRAVNQPLELVGSSMRLQGCFVKAAAEATGSSDFAQRLEADGILMRLDPLVEPRVFRGPILSRAELDSLRQITDVVRMGKVQRISSKEITFDEGSVASRTGHIYVDCTAAGIRPTVARPIFESDRLTLQYVLLGIVPHSAATIGYIETIHDDDEEKNRLCPALTGFGDIAGLLPLVYTGMSGIGARFGDADYSAWNEGCRLNPTRGANEHMDDPRVPEALATMGAHLVPAMENLARLVAEAAPAPV